MSRSYRKTPIMGYTTCRSEKLDKRLWHKIWRSQERVKLASESLNDSYNTTSHREVSNPWSMGKDGKHRFPIEEQTHFARKMADKKGHSPQERSALKKRLLHQWMGK